MRYALFGVLIASLLLAACNPGAAPAATETSTPIPPTARPATPTGEEKEPARDPVIVYERSGGIAGVSERWSIHADGRIEARDGSVRQVPPEEVARLREAIKAAGFWKLADSYGKDSPCRDCFTINLTVREDDMLKQVSAVLEATDTPAGLRDAVTEVDKLVRNR